MNEGIDFFFFNNPENITDLQLVRKYQGYELLFKIFPLLPKKIRLRLNEPSVRWVPARFKKLLGTIADVMNALKNKNPEMIAYIKYYVFHCLNYILRKFELKALKPNRIADKKYSRVEDVNAEAVFEAQ